MIFNRADTLRPGFSLLMELLCSLPRAPKCARLATLVKDLNLTKQTDLQRMLHQLREAGFEVHTSNHPDRGRVAYVTCMGWEHAAEAAESYWEMVWGDELEKQAAA